MTTTAIDPYTRRIQDNMIRLAAERGMSVAQLAELTYEPVTAFTGPRLFVTAIERAAHVLDVSLSKAFGLGECEPWCNDHKDDGTSDYCCRRVGEYAPDEPVEIWFDQDGTRISFDEPAKHAGYTLDQTRALVAALTEGIRVLDGAVDGPGPGLG